ncbi:MAG: hypothetical protein U0575_11205 [Phycisphaerales bacterium]
MPLERIATTLDTSRRSVDRAGPPRAWLYREIGDETPRRRDGAASAREA